MKSISKKGFTLLEVVIAAFIFITSVIGLFSVWTTHTRGVGKSRMVLIANELSEKSMEECVAARFRHVDRLVTDPLDPPPSTRVEFVIKDRELTAEFFTEVTVNEVLEDKIKEVIVDVKWTDTTTTAGEMRSVRLITELHSSS